MGSGTWFSREKESNGLEEASIRLGTIPLPLKSFLGGRENRADCTESETIPLSTDFPVLWDFQLITRSRISTVVLLLKIEHKTITPQKRPLGGISMRSLIETNKGLKAFMRFNIPFP